MTTKKEICDEVLFAFDKRHGLGRGVVSDGRRDSRFGVAKCELKKGHKGRHMTTKVTDFFKRIEW
jgi:hypothetical protein